MGSAAELLPPPGDSREREAGAAPVRYRRSPEEQVGAAERGRLGPAGGKGRAEAVPSGGSAARGGVPLS